MPAGFNGSGVYLRAYDWTNDKAANIKIQAVRMDEEMDGMAAALSKCITTTGQSTVESDIPMSNHKFTGLAQGTLPTDSVRFDQVTPPGGNNVFTGQNRFVNSEDLALVNVVNFEGDRPNPFDGDTATISFGLSDDAGTQVAAAQFVWKATDVSSGTQFDTTAAWAVRTAGVLNNVVGIDGGGFFPALPHFFNLGYPTSGWVALHLTSDLLAIPTPVKSEINWNNGDVRIIHDVTGTLQVRGTRTPFELHLSDPSVTGGPVFSLYREGAPIGGHGGLIQFNIKNSSGVKISAAAITTELQDISIGSEDAELHFWTYRAGGTTERLIVGAGLYHPATSDKGNNSINFGAIYQANVPLGNVAFRNTTNIVGGDVPLVGNDNTFSGTNYFTGAVSFSGGVYGGTTYFAGSRYEGANTFVGNNTYAVTQTSDAGGANVHGWIFKRPTANPGFSAIYIDNTGAVSANSRIQARFYVNSATVMGQIICDVNGINNTGDTLFQNLSDERFKSGVTPLIAGDIIDRLAPIRYRLGGEDGPEKIGFSAQELYEVVPEAASPGHGEPGDEDFVPWMRSMGVLEPVLVAELKALRARVAALEAA